MTLKNLDKTPFSWFGGKRDAAPAVRIVLAGFDTEHEVLEREHGWTCVEWFRGGFLKGGMGKQSEKGTSQKRERLWLSPNCLGQEEDTDEEEGSLDLISDIFE